MIKVVCGIIYNGNKIFIAGKIHGRFVGVSWW
jgi:hypothetical protein